MEALFALRMGSIVSSCDGNIIPYVTKHGSFNHSLLTCSSVKIGSQCKPFFYQGLKTWSSSKLFNSISLITLLTIKPSCQQNSMRYTIAVCTVLNTWWWSEELPETCSFITKKKFEKLVNLVGFIVRIYHDARSSGRQINHTYH